ncbi:exported protein of unknown function [Nitrospira moscoviensis]|uniref:Anti-sigma-28 factor FlgM C-terminal domain-containing protein n=1 Tax=Nitrospira moscoviensis TaxID=42253 RepID=A0A0K2GBU4_NITMO|nr:exported protein of unknown function [Nitrospira moscoviensis]
MKSAAMAAALVGVALSVGFDPPSLAAATGSAGSRGSALDHPPQAKPKSRKPAAAPRPSDQPSQPPLSREFLEERLRRGQMDEPIAQGRISERLEQFYRDSSEQSASKDSGR